MGQDMEAEKKAMESTIRAIILSNQGPVSVKELERDYQNMECERIKYEKFGFNNLVEFLRTFETLIIQGNGPFATVRAKTDSSSRHVTSLIDKQKSSKKKTSFFSAPRKARGSFHYQGPPRNYSEYKTVSHNKTYSSSEHRSYHVDTRKYATAEPRKYTPPPEPSYHRSNSTSDYQRFNPTTAQSSYQRSSSETPKPSPKESYHQSRTTEESWDNFSEPNHSTSDSRRGGYGSSSRGGYHGTANIPPRFQAKRQVETVDNAREQPSPPRFQAKRQVETVDNAREQLVVNIKDNERQVSYGESSSDEFLKHNIRSSEEKESIPKTKYNLPPRFQNLRRNNAKVYAQPTEPPSNPIMEDLNSRLSFCTLKTNEEPPNLLPSHHVAVGRALKQAEQLQYQAAYLPAVSLPEIPSQVQTPDFRGSILQNISLAETEAPVAIKKVPCQVPQSNSFSSNNGRATTTNIDVPEPDKEILQNNVRLLENYCLSQSLPLPEFNISYRRPEAGRLIMYTATVRITGVDQKSKKYSSWPNENINSEVSKGFAALKALEELRTEQLTRTVKISTDKITICERIHEMVVDNITGVVAWSIEDEYKKKYHEMLPNNWISVAINSSKLEVESLPTGHIIMPRTKYVVSSSMVTPPELKFPTSSLDPNLSEAWDVYVTRASGPNDVSFRLLGEDYDQMLDDLRERMEDHYKLTMNRENPLIYECDCYYAACIMNEMHRVRVLEVMKDEGQVKVLLVDHGDTDILPYESLYPLHPDFVQLPCQAVSCSLEGLEDHDDDQSKLMIATSGDLIGRALVAEIKHKVENPFKVTVVLFDTSGEETDININDKLLETLILHSSTPSLVPTNQSMTVIVSSVSLEGEVYVQVPGAALNKLIETTESITPEQLEKGKLSSYKLVKMQKTYLAKYVSNSLFCGWYRAVVLKPPSRTSNEITVQYVDYGNVGVVGISDLVDITDLPEILRIMPFQALKVEIHDFTLQVLNMMDIARLSSLLLDQEVFITTVDQLRIPPAVELQIDQEGTLTSISDAMASLRALESEINAGGKSGSLPSMPELENTDWQSLTINLCPNPSHFFFQVTKYCEELENLMVRMQSFYKILPAEAGNIDIKINQTYACLYPEDQAWYRVVVTQVLDQEAFIYLCDFGDTNIVPKANLRQLVSEFCQTPSLAVKACLGGLRPKHVDWHVEDITRFDQLVYNKRLLGKVLRIELNEQDLSDSRVVVKLFDPQEKKYIDNIFISEDRALRVPL